MRAPTPENNSKFSHSSYPQLPLRMWSSSSSSSPSSRSLSSSTSSSASAYPKLNNSKTMEEVWKDIALASDLPHHQSSSRGIILQDFFSKDPSPATVSSAAFSQGTAAPAPAPAPAPAVMLTLNSAPDHFGSMFLQPHNQPISHVSSLNLPFDALVDNGDAAGRKRLPEFDRSSGDRRHKRMIKNRESAARSRARKQAYTNELELEVAHLLEENARLKEQQKELYRAAAAQNQKKKGLHRTSTAPF